MTAPTTANIAFPLPQIRRQRPRLQYLETTHLVHHVDLDLDASTALRSGVARHACGRAGAAGSQWLPTTRVMGGIGCRDGYGSGRESLPQVPIFLNRQRLLEQTDALENIAAVRGTQRRGDVALEEPRVKVCRLPGPRQRRARPSVESSRRS